MADKNEVHLIGKLDKDPDVRFVMGNKSVCNFKVVTTTGKASAWHRVVAWDELAGKAGELREGDRVSVHGYLKYGSYTDKEGKKVYTTDVVALGLAKEGASAKKAEPQDVPPEDVPPDEDLPFN